MARKVLLRMKKGVVHNFKVFGERPRNFNDSGYMDYLLEDGYIFAAEFRGGSYFVERIPSRYYDSGDWVIRASDVELVRPIFDNRRVDEDGKV